MFCLIESLCLAPNCKLGKAWRLNLKNYLLTWFYEESEYLKDMGGAAEIVSALCMEDKLYSPDEQIKPVSDAASKKFDTAVPVSGIEQKKFDEMAAMYQ